MEIAWLIEDKDAGHARWWHGRGFSADSHEAVRFARRDDAEKVIRYLADKYVYPLIATEHAWDDGKRSTIEILKRFACKQLGINHEVSVDVVVREIEKPKTTEFQGREIENQNIRITVEPGIRPRHHIVTLYKTYGDGSVVKSTLTSDEARYVAKVLNEINQQEKNL